jgi:hypothetical protein
MSRREFKHCDGCLLVRPHFSENDCDNDGTVANWMEIRPPVDMDSEIEEALNTTDDDQIDLCPSCAKKVLELVFQIRREASGGNVLDAKQTRGN